MKRLSPVDQVFLWLEKPQQPMHVGALQLFRFPDDAGDDYVAHIADHLRSETSVTPPFNQRLNSKFGQLYWVDDKELDLEHHFRFEALPTPGRVRELLAMVSAEHSHPLDRERPLWECHLIEGFRERQFAIYTKVHHSLVDGVSAMRLFRKMLTDDPGKRNMPAIWSMPRSKKGQRHDEGPSLWQNVGHMLGESGKQLGTLPGVSKALLQTVREASNHPVYHSIFHAPPCILNQKITGSRRFAAQSYSLPRIRAICEASGTTINDVVMAMCASALRTFLINQNALPEKPLVAMVPVSLRHDDSGGGNQVGVILASLGTHLDDAAERLTYIHEDMKASKARYSQMTPEEILNYTSMLLAPASFQLLTGLAPKWQTFNVVISNVPGPSEKQYWNGAELVGSYPVSIAMDRMALNMTLNSYGDHIEFGLIGCRRTLPSLQRMLDYLEDGLKALETDWNL